MFSRKIGAPRLEESGPAEDIIAGGQIACDSSFKKEYKVRDKPEDRIQILLYARLVGAGKLGHVRGVFPTPTLVLAHVDLNPYTKVLPGPQARGDIPRNEPSRVSLYLLQAVLSSLDIFEKHHGLFTMGNNPRWHICPLLFTSIKSDLRSVLCDGGDFQCALHLL